jgi:hypothetical protein
LYFSLFGPKKSTKRKAAQQLGLRLSSRNTARAAAAKTRFAQTIPTLFRSQALRSAALQRVLKPFKTMINGIESMRQVVQKWSDARRATS